MINQIKILNNIISNNNQYKDNSFLWKTIKYVFDISESKAKKRAKEYCNVISLYGLLFATEKIKVSLQDFIMLGITTGMIRKDGFIKASKKDLVEYYGADIDLLGGKLIYYEKPMSYDDIFTCRVLPDNCFYQMKIKSRAGGFHFIACYTKEDNLYLSDSSNRGIDVLAKDVINKKQFMWLLKVG